MYSRSRALFGAMSFVSALFVSPAFAGHSQEGPAKAGPGGPPPVVAKTPPGAIGQFSVAGKTKIIFPRIACSPDGKSITASNYMNGNAVQWSIAQGKATSTVDAGADAPADGSNNTFVRVSPDGRFLLRENLPGKRSEVIDMSTGKTVLSLPKTLPQIGMMALFSRFSEDANTLYTYPPPQGKASRQITPYSTKTGNAGKSFDIPSDYQMATFVASPDGRNGAVVKGEPGKKTSLVVFNLTTGAVQSQFPLNGTPVISNDTVFFSPNNVNVGVRLTNTKGEPTFVAYDTITKTQSQIAGGPDAFAGVRFLPGTKIAVYGEKQNKSTDGMLTFFDFTTGKAALQMKMPAGGHVTSVAVCGNGRYVATGQANGDVTVWDAAKLFGALEPDAKAEKFAAIWDKLGNADPKVAHRAAWQLRTSPAMTKELATKLAEGSKIDSDHFANMRKLLATHQEGLRSMNQKTKDASRAYVEQWVRTGPTELVTGLLAPWLRNMPPADRNLVTQATWTALDTREAQGYRPSMFTQRLRLAREALDYLNREAAIGPMVP